MVKMSRDRLLLYMFSQSTLDELHKQCLPDCLTALLSKALFRQNKGDLL